MDLKDLTMIGVVPFHTGIYIAEPIVLQLTKGGLSKGDDEYNTQKFKAAFMEPVELLAVNEVLYEKGFRPGDWVYIRTGAFGSSGQPGTLSQPIGGRDVIHVDQHYINGKVIGSTTELQKTRTRLGAERENEKKLIAARTADAALSGVQGVHSGGVGDNIKPLGKSLPLESVKK